jgi:hypothetical protein
MLITCTETSVGRRQNARRIHFTLRSSVDPQWAAAAGPRPCGRRMKNTTGVSRKNV